MEMTDKDREFLRMAAAKSEAGVARIYYGNTKDDAAAIDFSDKFIYEELDRPMALRSIPCVHIPDSGAIRAFRMWADKTDKI